MAPVEPVVTSYKIKPKAQQDDELSPGVEIVSMHKTVIFVSIIGCLCMTLIVAMFLVRHIQKRRRSMMDPEFYKKSLKKKQQRQDHSSASQSAREEFSEIRYLTQDEHLDFSLASPSSFRPQSSFAAAEEPLVSTAGQVSEDESALAVNETDSSGTLAKKKKKKTKETEETVNSNNAKKGKQPKKAYLDNDNEGLLGQDGTDDDEW